MSSSWEAARQRSGIEYLQQVRRLGVVYSMLMGDDDTGNGKQKYEYQIVFRDEFIKRASVSAI